ncbi:MAG: hypothetical protein ABIO39_08575 [Caulobacteraceae bacterium]
MDGSHIAENETGSVPACANSGRPAVFQRADQDCLLCAFAMFAGLDYEQAATAAQMLHPPYEPLSTPMSHALMRRMAHEAGLVLLSSIYMDWRFPGIVGVVSLTQEDCGHALFWDGKALIDPGRTGLYDRAYVDTHALEFTQRANDLGEVFALDRKFAASAIRLWEAF